MNPQNPSQPSGMIHQSQIPPGEIKPRHLAADTTMIAGDTYHVGPDGIFQRSQAVFTGWVPSLYDWTYFSATSVTIQGDQTKFYELGVKLRWQTGSTTNYGLVKSSSYNNGITTLSIIPNDDFIFTNTTITNPSYSYMNSLSDWWGFFDYGVGSLTSSAQLSFTTQGGAFTNSPTVNEVGFDFIDQRINLNFNITLANPSGGTGHIYIGNLPTTIKFTGIAGTGIENNNGKTLAVFANSNNQRIEVSLYDGTTAIANGDQLYFAISYYC